MNPKSEPTTTLYGVSDITLDLINKAIAKLETAKAELLAPKNKAGDIVSHNGSDHATNYLLVSASTLRALVGKRDNDDDLIPLFIDSWGEPARANFDVQGKTRIRNHGRALKIIPQLNP